MKELKSNIKKMSFWLSLLVTQWVRHLTDYNYGQNERNAIGIPHLKCVSLVIQNNRTLVVFFFSLHLFLKYLTACLYYRICAYLFIYVYCLSVFLSGLLPLRLIYRSNDLEFSLIFAVSVLSCNSCSFNYATVFYLIVGILEYIFICIDDTNISIFRDKTWFT